MCPSVDQGLGGKESDKTRQYKALASRLECEMGIAMYFIANEVGVEGASAFDVSREVFGSSKTDKVKRIVEASEHFGLMKPSRNRLNIVPLQAPARPGNIQQPLPLCEGGPATPNELL